MASAEKLVQKGKIEPAIKEYERLLDDNPNDVNTLNRIGDLWVRINRTDEAVKTYGRIADHYSRDGFFLKAIAIYKKINKLDPSKLDVYAKLADLYAKQGLAMEAKSQYQVLADYYLKHGDPQNALSIYRKISELDPNSINVHVKLADLHGQAGQTAEALKEYDRVGRMLLKRGMLDEAVQVFKKALKIDARNVDLVESLVTALIEAKDYKNAIAIVEQALETNKNNPRLLAMWGRILIAQGDLASARSALERGLAAEPNEPAIREALADLYLKQNDANRALEMMAPLVERALGRAERGQAVELLTRVLRVDQRHTPTLERLVALYTRLNEETNILSSMNLLAEAHMARGQFPQAAGVLERLIEREPQNAQHRTKLQFVRSQIGGVDTVPVKPKTQHDVPVSLEVDEPTPTFEEEPAPAALPPIELSQPSMDLDFGNDTGPALTIGEEAEPAPSETEANDDLDFITEHLTEAEVFAKYGLAEKATEHLRAVIDRSPKHAAAYDRLYRLQLDEGDIESARSTAAQYISILEEAGETDAIDAVNTEFISRGQTLRAKPKTFAGKTPVPVVETPPPVMEADAELVTELQADEEISFDLDAGPSFDSAAITAEPETVEELPAALEIEEEPAVEFEPATEAEAEPAIEELAEIPPAMEAAEPEIEIAEEEPAIEVSAAPEIEIAAEPSFEPEPELPRFEPPLPEPEPEPELPPLAIEEPQPFYEVESIAAEVEAENPSVEEIGEIDFYIEQELFDEARQKADALLARFPDSDEVVSRIDRIDAAAAAVPPPPPRPSAPPTPHVSSPALLSRDEIENELLSAIPDDDDDFGSVASAPPPPPPPPPAAVAPPVQNFSATPIEEENLFADEDDFFDLAAELESELDDSSDDVVALSEEEQSLEEIFKEFKKGVEQQLDSEDYDTHYNLGIAYKEMGLIDEAIGEFQLASKDPKRAVECSSMLGLCFLEKGMPQLAIKWYRKGLEMPEITEEEHIGLLYDLGSAFVEVGDTDNAQKAFMEVYGLNSNYRDVINRIKQLEDAKR